MRKTRRELERESDSKLFCILSLGHIVLYHLSYHKCYETHLLGNNGLTQSTHSATKMLRFQEVEPASTLSPASSETLLRTSLEIVAAKEIQVSTWESYKAKVSWYRARTMLTLLNCYSLDTKHSETAKRKPGIFSETVSFKALWSGSIKQLRRKARTLHYASVVDTSSTIIFSPAVCFLMAAEVWESEPRRSKSNRIQMGHPHPTSVKSKIRTLVFTHDL